MELFEKRIRPVLVDNCHRCHSARSQRLRGELRLDTRAGLLRGGQSGRSAVVPGHPDRSPLIQAVRYLDDLLQMPPSGRLPDDAIADLTRWVEMGAPYPDESPPQAPAAPPAGEAPAEQRRHWSFQPLQTPPVPEPRDLSWPQGPVDRFILARLDQKGLTPAGPADKRTWLRRVTCDLTGLPPTPDEIAGFLQDDTPQSFARVVDRLLASPRYGEQWGRHWLDLARYADTSGDSSDYPIPEARLYRDYVIDAFNRDKPYDRFIREQIAGDLLPAADEAQRCQQTIATGFVALSRRFGVGPEHQLHLTIEDTIDTLGKAVLGLTVSCARCHDHKFDPISTDDYYGLYGFFSSTQYPFAGSENRPRPHHRVLLLPPQEVREKFKNVSAALDEAEAIIEQINGDSKRRKEQNDAIARRDKIYKDLSPVPFAYALAEGTPADAAVQIRGEPGRRGRVVPRRFLTALGGQTLPPGTKGSGRLELARWLTDPQNPLIARVMVNRIWQHHFGKGLVATPSDFGTRGQPPTHPELLDYLARRFIDCGWSVKTMHREIMLSAAYRMSSASNPRFAEIDPNNDLLWHFPRRRLTAEEIRDTMLAVSGELDLQRPGRHPFPPEWEWRYTQHAAFTAVYESRHRSVYVMQQRLRKHPFFALFDGADTNTSTASRIDGTTPLQALFFMNDRFVFDRADALGARLAREAPSDLERIHLACELLFGRPPQAKEIARSVDYLRRYEEQSADATSQPAARSASSALASFARVLMSTNEFMFVD